MMLLKKKAMLLMSWLVLAGAVAQAQQDKTTLSVEKIMRDPKWIGTSPSTSHDISSMAFFLRSIIG